MKKKKPNLELAMQIAAPIIKKQAEEANEMVTAIGKEMMEDQVKWLDQQMADILPPALYQAGLRGEMETLIGEYMAKHRIQIVFIPDRLVLRIMLGDKVHSQFVPQLLVDGEKVEWNQDGGAFKPEQN